MNTKHSRNWDVDDRVNFLKFWGEEKERDKMGDKHIHTSFYESASVKWWIITSAKKIGRKEKKIREEDISLSLSLSLSLFPYSEKKNHFSG